MARVSDITPAIFKSFSALRIHRALNKSLVLAAGLTLVIVLRFYRTRRSRVRAPRLLGPPSKSFLLGAAEGIVNSTDPGALYADWEKKYGSVYEIPYSFGSKMLVLGDPKGLAHLLANDTTTYHQLSMTKLASERLFGATLFATEGEAHKRQRKAVSLAFSTYTIRNLVPVFLDCAKKLTTVWYGLLETESQSGSITTDVQKWMNLLSIDSIGKGALSYDFQSLEDGHSSVVEAFTCFTSLKPNLLLIIRLILGPFFPSILFGPLTEHGRAMKALSDCVKEISRKLLATVPGEFSGVVDNSVIGALVNAGRASPKSCVTIEEIGIQVCDSTLHSLDYRIDCGQMLMIAGYESTASSLTWALVELSRHPEIQNALRAELQEKISAGEEVTFDMLTNDLPYLGAFTLEILRLHPSVGEMMRQVNEDDTIPLSKPIVTAPGTIINSLPVAKGTVIRVPIIGIQQSEALWGPDAATFDPGRWLEKPGELDKLREDMPGFRHLLTFGHGARMCLGRYFELAAFKAMLSVLVRRFTFEFPDGPATKLDVHRSISLRPRVVGEDGARIPLIIRKVSTLEVKNAGHLNS